MQGMPFSLDGDGRVLFSWMSRDKAYWSLSDAGAKEFGPRVAAPGGGRRAYPVAVRNRKGEVLFVWTADGQVRWALYREDGTLTERSGSAGAAPGKNKPTATVGPGDQFIIIF